MIGWSFCGWSQVRRGQKLRDTSVINKIVAIWANCCRSCCLVLGLVAGAGDQTSCKSGFRAGCCRPSFAGCCRPHVLVKFAADGGT